MTTTARARTGVAQASIMAVLTSVFNFLLLNMALLVASLPIVTLPLAVNAATVALDRWRLDGEDRVLREFLVALRSQAPLRTTVVVGAPIVMVGLGAAEVGYFAVPHGLGACLSLGLGLSGFLVVLTSLGYVFLVAARYPEMSASDTWALCARLAIRNLFATGPLFLLEIFVVTGLALLEPGLLVFAAPLALICLLRVTAGFGIRRASATGGAQ